MPFAYANQHDIDAMTKALDAYCRECAITGDLDRTETAERIASLFFMGRTTAEEILEALRAGDAQGDRALTRPAA